jgi:hypothetical protein
VAPTQDALYAELDLELSWSEQDLPERERTRHVHRLHPYLGKFIPQLVEVLLGRYFRPGQHVLDPFAGSGTTLVQALEGGLDATGVDVAAFNCLLMEVKTRAYNPFVLEQDLRAAHARIGETAAARPSAYVRRWYAPQAARELLGFRRARRRVRARRRAACRPRTGRPVGTPDDALRPRLPPRAADRAVLVPQAPARVPPGRDGLAVSPALHARHARAAEGVRACAGARASATVVHGDVRRLELGRFDGVLTSPPYPG